LALEITEADTSPFLIKGASFREVLDDKIKKRQLKEARELKNRLENVDVNLYLPSLLKNMKNALIKKNEKDYDCEKTII